MAKLGSDSPRQHRRPRAAFAEERKTQQNRREEEKRREEKRREEKRRENGNRGNEMLCFLDCYIAIVGIINRKCFVTFSMSFR
jgi:hypothetical protein